MMQIFAKEFKGSIYGYEITFEGHTTELARQDLEDFVDSDSEVIFANGIKEDVNDYLGVDSCSAVRRSNHHGF